MPALRRLAIFLLALLCSGVAAVAQSQVELAAVQALGPHWKLLSRASGTAFAGEVLEIKTLPVAKDAPIPIIQFKFKVERAISGVQPGQVITIREWEGAWPNHRPMRVGQHFLLFFYPPSTLGLTSPVGGAMGQIELDANGKILTPTRAVAAARGTSRPSSPFRSASQPSIHWRQLQRAVLSAREE